MEMGSKIPIVFLFFFATLSSNSLESHCSKIDNTFNYLLDNCQGLRHYKRLFLSITDTAVIKSYLCNWEKYKTCQGNSDQYIFNQE